MRGQEKARKEGWVCNYRHAKRSIESDPSVVRLIVGNSPTTTRAGMWNKDMYRSLYVQSGASGVGLRLCRGSAKPSSGRGRGVGHRMLCVIIYKMARETG